MMLIIIDVANEVDNAKLEALDLLRQLSNTAITADAGATVPAFDGFGIRSGGFAIVERITIADTAGQSK